MISLYKQDGELLYGIKEFLLDSESDLLELPTNIKSGSSALVIPTGKKYFLNGAKQWVALGNSSNSGGGGSSNETILAQLDKDNDGIIDQAEEAHGILMYEM